MKKLIESGTFFRVALRIYIGINLINDVTLFKTLRSTDLYEKYDHLHMRWLTTYNCKNCITSKKIQKGLSTIWQGIH